MEVWLRLTERDATQKAAIETRQGATMEATQQVTMEATEVDTSMRATQEAQEESKRTRSGSRAR